MNNYSPTQTTKTSNYIPHSPWEVEQEASELDSALCAAPTLSLAEESTGWEGEGRIGEHESKCEGQLESQKREHLTEAEGFKVLQHTITH